MKKNKNSANFVLYILIALLPVVLSACMRHSIKPQHPSFALSNTMYTHLGDRVARQVREHNGKSGFYMLSDGMQALSALVRLSRNATRSLDIQSYIYHDDRTGKLLANELLKAADRGVRIRLLLDDMFSAGKESLLATLNSHPNIEVRLFNPITTLKMLRAVVLFTDFSRVNRRMHNKAFIADNQVVIMGGRNIGDAYFMRKQRFLFSDMDVLSIGPVVQKISHSFDLYWNSKWAVSASAYRGFVKKAYKIANPREMRVKLADQASAVWKSSYGKALASISVANDLLRSRLPLLWAESKVFYDPPGKVRGGARFNPKFLESKLNPYLDQAQSEVVIVTPYFVPQRRGMRWIKKLRKRGVKISILTNSYASNDHAIAHTGYIRYRKKLLKLGVNLYEFRPDAFQRKRRMAEWYKKIPRSSLHSKLIVIDRNIVITGSSNLSPRSRYLNTEIAVVLKGRQMANRTIAYFQKMVSPMNSYRLVLHKRRFFRTSVGYEPEVAWQTYSSVHGRYVRYLKEPGTWFIPSIGVTVLGILPLENML